MDPVNSFEELYHLEYNWDGDNAFAPEECAIQAAKDYFEKLKTAGLSDAVYDVSPDVCGGVEIHLGTADNHVWLSFMNCGANSVVFSHPNERKVVGSEMLSEDSLQRIMEFLNEET